ncbi:MAG TPA: glycoside hydrolase family 57 protein [Gammaproteobacteria bacterium]|nr:glycoside hydrolase family 57 protein [Gammaproteobacteria bacterium]
MSTKLNVVLYWHMHQPEYRDIRSGLYHQPWVYLHVIKDYVDMAAHLEANPDARAVVNFAPILLEQIDDYSKQLKGYIELGEGLRDPLLMALAGPVIKKYPENWLRLMKACLRANEKRMIKRFEHFDLLINMAHAAVNDPPIIGYYDEQYMADILVWYHLAWMGETVRRNDPRVKTLMEKECSYTLHDRRQLLEIIYELNASVIARYRVLAEQGRIELSMTPYAHPIVPLLLDVQSTRQAMPDAPMPLLKKYPGGVERSHWHMQKGIETFKHYFGFTPTGCWPSEGSVSGETVELLQQYGIKWLASGETVLRNSLHKSGIDTNHCIHTAYQYRDSSPYCFFRDDGLSDHIGFKYSEWHADDAVANLIHHLKNISQACSGKPDAIVSIILDGENAWEYYPENGYYFLNALYEALSSSDDINLTTYSEYLKTHAQAAKLPEMVAGSWVYGTFSTWIGSTDKNRAWDMLADVKNVYDRAMASGQLPEGIKIKAEKQLAICEGSDWFWWFGDYNAAESVSAFDEQYRMHLSNLYSLLAVEPPQYLSHSFSHGSVTSASTGVMLPGKHNQ